MNNFNNIFSILNSMNSNQNNNTNSHLYPNSFESNSNNKADNINLNMLNSLLSKDNSSLMTMLTKNNPMLSNLLPLLQQKKTANKTSKVTTLDKKIKVDFSTFTKVDDYHKST